MLEMARRPRRPAPPHMISPMKKASGVTWTLTLAEQILLARKWCGTTANQSGRCVIMAILSTQAGTLLKAALAQPEAQGRLLENLTFTQNHFNYEITSSGNVTNFKGRETIHAENSLAYALDYFGGMVKA